MTLPPDYRDSRAKYQDIPLLCMYNRQPENEPLLVLDEAPFPIWIVPPGWRMARLSAIAAVTKNATLEQVEELLKETGVLVGDSIDLWGWKETVKTWPIAGTNDHIIFWRRGH